MVLIHKRTVFVLKSYILEEDFDYNSLIFIYLMRWHSIGR